MYGVPGQVNVKRHIINVTLWEFYEAYSSRAKAITLLDKLGNANNRGELISRLDLQLTKKMQFTASINKELDSLFLSTIKANYTAIDACLNSAGATTANKTENEVVGESLFGSVRPNDLSSITNSPQLPVDTFQAVGSFVALFDFLQSKLVALNGIEILADLKRQIADSMLRSSASADTQASSSSGGEVKQVDGDDIDLFSSFMQRCRDLLEVNYRTLLDAAHAISQAIVEGTNTDDAWSSYQASHDRWFPAPPSKKFFFVFDSSDYTRWQKRQDLIMHLISSESFKELKQAFQKPAADLFLNQINRRSNNISEVKQGAAKLSDENKTSDIALYGNLMPSIERFQLFFNGDGNYSTRLEFYRCFLIHCLWSSCPEVRKETPADGEEVLSSNEKVQLMILTMPLAHSLYRKDKFKEHLSEITSLINVVFRDLFSSGDRQQDDEEVSEQVYRISDGLLRLFEFFSKYCGPLTTDINAIFIRIVRFINYPIKQQLLIKRMPLVYENLSLEGFTDYLLTVSSFVGVKSAGALDRKAINETTTELLRLFNSSLELCEGLQQLNIVNSLIDVVRAICCNLPDADTTTSLEQSTADSKRVNDGLSENSESPLLFHVQLTDTDRSNSEKETQFTINGEQKSSFESSKHRYERKNFNNKTLLPSGLERYNSHSESGVHGGSKDDWNVNYNPFCANPSKRASSIGNRQRRSQSVVNVARFLQDSSRPESPICMNGQLYSHQHDKDACFSMPPKVVPGYIDCESPTVFTRLIQSCLLLPDKQECRDLRSQVTSFLATIDITIDLNDSVGFIEQLQKNIISEFKKNKLCIRLGRYYEFAGHTFKVVSREYGQTSAALMTIFPEGYETIEQINISSEELLAAADDSETDLCSVTCVMV